jgi:hypothetical protein
VNYIYIYVALRDNERNHATREIQKRALHLAHDPVGGDSTLGARQTFNKEGLLKGFAASACADANFMQKLGETVHICTKEDD